jgi:hypothetical protein
MKRSAAEIAARVAELERQREIAGYADDRHRIYTLAAALAEHVWYAAGSTPPGVRPADEIRAEIERRNSWLAAAQEHNDGFQIRYIEGQIEALRWSLTVAKPQEPK